jgi:toxin ParE1/3/4
MSRYRFTPQAQLDLNDIHDLVARHNPAAAARLIDAAERRGQAFANPPGRGRADGHLAPGLRLSSVRRYTIFFRPVTDGVEIIRILRSARDSPSVFRP